MASRTLLLAAVLALSAVEDAPAVVDVNERVLADTEYAQIAEAKSVYIDLTFSTWHPRGRTLSQIGPALKIKLTNAGFTVVPKASDPHDLTLKVRYREERGQQYKFDTYGTEITCEVKLEHASAGSLLDLTIRETSGAYDSGTPPYLEALERFDTNPYFYFLGEIVSSRTRSRSDVTQALIRSLQQMIQAETPKTEQLQDAHGFLPGESLYPALVRENTIRELGRLRDDRAVPVLTALLGHASRQTRLASIEALTPLRDSAEVRSALERMATGDRDPEIRRAAASALSASTPASPVN
jgi:Arc/MetJ-type ribon-helix-helix transcriptional regulator